MSKRKPESQAQAGGESKGPGKYRIGVDVGGTFSDLVVFDEDRGEIEVIKVPSTPDDPSRGVINGLSQLFEEGVKPGEITFFCHGCTVATNALLEDKGARVGLLVTEGFSGINDVHQVPAFGPDSLNLYIERRVPVPPRFRFEVGERVDFEGNVIKPLDREQAVGCIRKLKEKGVESIAVVLLFSFLNPQHEYELEELIKREFPGCNISLSAKILPRIREFPRLSTTVANASIAPVLQSYLQRLERQLNEKQVNTRQLYIIQSNGGMAKLGSVLPISTALSGPSGGYVAGLQIGAAAGFDNVLSVDMGGTSFDIALIDRGEAQEKAEGTVGRWELATNMLDIHTIGAGGGSIAWLDKVGNLHVGPRSAGAAPGPVCYDKGGTEPTVTDANVVLGLIDPDYFLGGKIKLNKAKAEKSIQEKIAGPLHLGLLEAAEGIIKIVNTNMEEGIKAVSTERGYDLRDFVLIPFGGAGPVHGARLAADLGIGKVLVPPVPGATSALGFLMSDVRKDYIRSTKLGLLSTADTVEVNRIFADIAKTATGDLLADGFSAEEINLTYYMDLRYLGQGYELTIPAPHSGRQERNDLDLMRVRFDEYHGRRFGHKAPNEPVEIVSYRVKASVLVPKPSFKRYEKVGTTIKAAFKRRRDACFGPEGMVSCPVYERKLLGTGHIITGPAIIEQVDSTTVVLPKQTASIDAFRNIIISVPPES